MLIVPKIFREGDAVQKKLHRYSLKASVLASALALLPLGAGAAGLGKITVLSALGQPLRAEVELMASREELSSITARFASHDAFKQAGLDFVPALAGVKVTLDKRPSGQSFIRLSSERPVDEPFLDFLLELSWSSGRLVREYTFLLDPPPEMLAPKPAPQVALPTAKPAAPVVTQPVMAPVAPEQRVMEEKPAAKKPDDAKSAKGPVEAPKPPLSAKELAKEAPAAAPRESRDGQATREVEVKTGDTLNKIATETKPEGVSLDQMLVAIFQNNQDAFVGNVHRLKAGKILAIPERDAVAAVTPAEARRVISAHTADFNTYRQKLAFAAGSSEAKEQAPRQTAAGKIAPKVEEIAPAAQSKDQIKISKSESGKEARAAQGRIAALEEDLTAKGKALKEAQSRQTDLEKNVKDLQKLLDLKNQNLADLQKQAAAKPAPLPVPEVKKPEPPAPAKVAEAVKPAEPPKPVEAPKPVEVTPPPVPVPAIAEKPAEPAKPVEAPKPVAKKPAAPPPPEEPGLLDTLMDNPAIPAGGLLVLALAGYAVFRQRRKRGSDSDATPTTTANLATNSVFGATGGQSVDTTGASSMATDFSQASISAIDSEEGVDPVAEADVYMAYGRDAQAEEILLDALKSDPARTAIHVKLLEIYAARKNTKQFETLASDLYAQTSGVGADWEKAAAMGQKLDPANPLYGGGPITPGGATDTTVIVPADQKMHSTWTMPGELSQIAQAVENGTATALIENDTAGAVEVAPMMPANLDFDLDLGTSAKPSVSSVAAPIKAAAEESLDFDLGLDSRRPAGPVIDPDATMILDVSKDLKPADSSMDFKLGEDQVVTTADEGLHFDLDLGQTPATPAPEVIDFDKTVAGGNVMDFDFNLGTSPAEQQPQAAEPMLDLGDINLDLGTPSAAGGDDVSTKLELAKAYEEMGDKEGARELLQEVVKEGSGEQQEKARGMLSRLS